MSQLGTDHIAASLLDDLDEKVQQLEFRDSAKQNIPQGSTDLENPSNEILNPYVDIEISPKIQLVQAKREGKLSQLLKKTPLEKPSYSTSPPHEAESHFSGGESPPMPMYSRRLNEPLLKQTRSSLAV
ncbi:hypothetical protein DSO57_1002178 [Entomophthora muscae]|uniref:Uncharacterized protein n=1 Tax=Entomophthora muscae TaxID=34485 RepID=A0ACC2T8V3_9FUNG|nr:hypothetical protein DSO57_1002178 [Entomophthora muscae]